MLTTAHENRGEDPLPLNQFIEIRRRFLRSVNLEHDFSTTAAIEGYIPTSAAINALARIVEGVRHVNARAFNVTGAYGSGKSAFALFASKVLAASGESDNALRSQLVATQPRFRDSLPSSNRGGFIPVLITGGRMAVGRGLLNGLVRTLRQSPTDGIRGVGNRFEQRYGELIAMSNPTSSAVVDAFAYASRLVQEEVPDCHGLLVVIDEMGKFLEFAALHPDQGDLQVLQELAEHAVRSETAPLLLITILHQAFEEYAHRLTSTQRREWQKVQGRFADIPFANGTDETIHLISRAIERKAPDAEYESLDRRAAQSLDWCKRLGLIPRGLSVSEFSELLRGTYPLHPLTLLLLPHAFRRFGQSERSLFSFLSSEESFGFQEFLQGATLSAASAPVVRPDRLYDYIVNTLSSSIYSQSSSKLWSETEEGIFRLRDSDPLRTRLVKTIGLLHILGEQTGILPSKQVLQFALCDEEVTPAAVDAALDALRTSTIVVYRQFKQAYRLFEGSDVDIEARLRDARAHYSHGTDSVKVAASLEVSSPVVARRHSYRTGTIRILAVRHCRPATLEAEIRAGGGQADGAVLLCLAANQEEIETVAEMAAIFLPSFPEIVVGASIESEAMAESAVAVECLQWVLEETPELRLDRVATREVRERLHEATHAFHEEWNRQLRPQGVAPYRPDSIFDRWIVADLKLTNAIPDTYGLRA